jgi:hypothetical protein
VSVVDVVFQAHDLLDRLGVDHAFGGALALAYYTDPRGTVDVDVNVFVLFSSASPVVLEFSRLGFEPERPSEQWASVAGVRIVRPQDPVRLDLFFSIDEHYEEIARRTRLFPFGPDSRELPFLSAEDLAIFKLSFGRDKDWVDLRRLAAAHPEIDLAYIERQLIGIRGPSMYPRLARMRTLTRPGP